MITCKLTNSYGKGVKAHIIPKSFYELAPQSEGPCRLISNVSGTYPKKSPVGIYDGNIVTKEGESLFEEWDNYAAWLLIENFGNFTEMLKNQEIVAWQVQEYDYAKLKLFALSVLWRAAASKHIAFSKVNLGPHEEAIKKMLLNNNPGSPSEYSVNIARWKDDDFGPIFMDPFREKYESVNYYRIYCGRYIFYVKVDKKNNIDKLMKLQLGSGSELCIIARELKGSKEWPIMEQIVMKNTLTK